LQRLLEHGESRPRTGYCLGSQAPTLVG
jgi:hypothetical protein